MAQDTVALGAEPGILRFGNGTTLAGLGGSGEVRQRRPLAGRLRSDQLPAERDTSPLFEHALRGAGIVEQETLQLRAVSLRAGAHDKVTLMPAVAAGDRRPRVVLYQDESGGLSWHFPLPCRADGLRAASEAQRFVIPLRNAAVARAMAAGTPRHNLRGPITKVGRKLFKVLVLPAASTLLRNPVRWLADSVEARLHPYRIWRVTPDNYRDAPADDLRDWADLTAGPVLLLVHGIFSSVQGMLAGLPRDSLQRWFDRYQGRVIGFNHPSVSASPEDNATHFLRTMAAALPGRRLVIDIVCHSRGGIVSRALSERGVALVGPNGCAVRSVYFVGTPNAGSPLGDADHMADMIDLFTNFLTNLPDGPLVYSVELLVGLVTLMGHAVARGLPGIAALGTQGSYVVDRLNRSADKVRAHYAATAADYQPAPGRENGWLLDRLADPAMDCVFARHGQREANDLVVPLNGVFAANGHPSFPIRDTLLYGAADGVWHTAFFAHPRTLAHIDAFFDRAQGASPAPADAAPALRGGLRGGAGRAASPTRGSGGAGRADEIGSSQAIASAGGTDRVDRDPVMRFADRMEAGQAEELYVALNAPSGGPVPPDRLRLGFDAGASEIALVAELSAPGFRIDGARRADLHIMRERDASLEHAIFRLIALDPGPQPVQRAIDVSFWRGNDCVGGMTHHTVVVPKGYAGDVVNDPERCSSLRIVPDRQRQSADLVLYVRRPDSSRDVFELNARSAVYGDEYEMRPFGSFDLDGRELSQYLRDAIDHCFDRFPGAEVPDTQFPDALAQWNREFMRALFDLGKQLWLHLPSAFRQEYMRLAALPSPPRSLFIFSDELTFPWEIVRPSGMIRGRYEELPTLGALHVLGRWRPGTAARPQPQNLPVGKMALLMPDAQAAQLPWAQSEIDEIHRLVPHATLLRPVTRAEVDGLLAESDVQLVHFSGHGSVGANADLSELVLEGSSTISAMAFAATALGIVAQPVLYLNACTVGRGGRVMSRAGGFAGNCIEAGWSGVIAPYWPVYDPSAAAFSVAFYTKLKSGCAIGEALQELRSERPEDPTAQSYAYFGDPFARLRL